MKHRLDYGGNRRINSVFYIARVTHQRDRHDARANIDGKLTEGKTRHEARRAHKRHLSKPSHPAHMERRITRARTTQHNGGLTRERQIIPPQGLLLRSATWVKVQRPQRREDERP